jgi:DinB superfamily
MQSLKTESPPAALTPNQAVALLDTSGAAVRGELAAAPDAALTWHPAPGEWCVKETLGHLLEAERRGFNGRIRRMLEAHEPPLPGWDQQAVARERQDCSRPTEALLREFTDLRADSLQLISGLQAADLERGGMHDKVGHLRVGDLLHEWVHHDRNHLKQMLSNVQAYVWPHMANTQKFSGE